MDSTLLVLLAVVGATWTAFNTCLSTVKYLNELRDQILTGKVGGNLISASHRRIIFSDWLGSAVFYVIMGASYAVAIALVPFLVGPDQRPVIGAICGIFAVVVFLGTAVPGSIAFITERPEMLLALKDSTKTSDPT